MNAVLLDAAALKRTLARMAHEVAERNPDPSRVVVIGVQSGGVILAQRLAALLQEIWGRTVPHGTLDVSMHRDDLDQRGTLVVRSTNIPADISDKTVILVDDVLYSGRTTRAALDALTDYGRPERVQLAVLIDRGHRELPITADFVCRRVTTSRQQRIDVRLANDSGKDEVLLEEPRS
jgi:pyrimidine operon attenuation protein/uracil phosphoribosyltransferase